MSGSKALHSYLLGITVAAWVGVYGAVVAVSSQPSVVSGFAHLQFRDFATDKPERLRRIYTAEIGVREASGKNDGRRVGEYLRYVGLPEGYAYCAAFVCWALGEAGIENPKNGWSPALFPARRVIWNQDQAYAQRTTRNKEQRQSLLLAPAVLRQQRPQSGDVFGIYYSDLKRIAHCGFVDNWDGTWCITVEANTSPDQAVTARGDPANPIRAGPSAEGVYRKKRLVRTIYRVASWGE